MSELFLHEPSPAGYPRLGLVARTLRLPDRSHATAASIGHRLTMWERERGNAGFVVTGLEALSPAQRLELAHVYVALRERYPHVTVDRLDLAARQLPGRLGETLVYHANFPLLRAALAEVGAGGTPETYALALALSKTLGRRGQELAAEVEATREFRVADVTAAGSIKLSVVTTSTKGRTAQASRWSATNRSRLRRKLPVEILPSGVSLAALTLVHEFGHLVDGTVAAGGSQIVDRVYGRLSEVLLGGGRPHLYQWRRHLANYPAWALSNASGPVSGGSVRAQTTRAALSPLITEQLGTYAASSRDELFAEAFMLAWVARDPSLRSQLSPLRDELVAVGIGRSTAPRRHARRTRTVPTTDGLSIEMFTASAAEDREPSRTAAGSADQPGLAEPPLAGQAGEEASTSQVTSTPTTHGPITGPCAPGLPASSAA